MIDKYIKELTSELLGPKTPELIEAFADTLEKTRNNNGKIFVVGNGGSASTASHFVNDLLKVDTPANTNNFHAYALTDVAVITASANDFSYEDAFVYQLKKLHDNVNDLLVVISASGNSPNILKAIKYFYGQKFGLLGFNGGKAANLLYIPGKINDIVSESHNYGVVEDCHLAVCHMVTQYLQWRYDQ